MNTEAVKKLAKEQYGKELTDEEAEKLLAAAQAEGELSEADLEGVSGGSVYTRREAVLDDTIAECLPYIQKQEEKKKKVLGLL